MYVFPLLIIVKIFSFVLAKVKRALKVFKWIREMFNILVGYSVVIRVCCEFYLVIQAVWKKP